MNRSTPRIPRIMKNSMTLDTWLGASNGPENWTTGRRMHQAEKTRTGALGNHDKRFLLEPAWREYIRRHWTLLIGMMARRSRREVCQQSILEIHDALGRQMNTKVGAMLVGMTDRSSGTLSGHRVIKMIIDPGATRTSLDQQTAIGNDIAYRPGSTMRIELANGTIETPVGETIRQESIELGGVSVDVRLLVVKSHGAYGILIRRDWLRRVSATTNYRDMVYCIRAGGKRAAIKQNRVSCEVLSAEVEESDSSEESSSEPRDDEPKKSDYSHVATWRWLCHSMSIGSKQGPSLLRIHHLGLHTHHQEQIACLGVPTRKMITG